MSDRDKVVRELHLAECGQFHSGDQKAYDAGRAEGYAEGQRAERADVVADIDAVAGDWFGDGQNAKGDACGYLTGRIRSGAHHREGQKP